MLTFEDVVLFICVRRCWNGGHTVAEIAKVSKCSQQRVRQMLQDSGVPVIDGKLWRAKLTRSEGNEGATCVMS